MSHDPRADKSHRGKASSTSKIFHRPQNKPAPHCARVQARLLSYLDGGLSERERVAIQQHLDSCERCQQELALYQMSEQALSNALHAVPTAGDLRPTFYARLASETAPRSSRPSKLNWRLAVPALAACGLLAGWLTVPHQRPASPVIARMDQENRMARIAKKDANNGSVVGASIDTPPENQATQPVSPALPNALIARSGVTLPPVRTGMESGIRRITPEASQHAGTKRKSAALIVARVERHREIGTLWALMKPSAPANSARFFAYGEQNNMPGLKAVAPPTDYALSLNEDTLFKAQNKNSLALNTPAPGPTPRYSLVAPLFNGIAVGKTPSTGDNAGDSLESSAKDNADKNSEDSGIAIQVRDSRRGFTSSLRLASRVQRHDGQQVLTIHVEDEDANDSSDAYTPLPGEVRMEPK